MDWNLFWGLYMLAFAAAGWIAFGITYIGSRRQARRCTAHAAGQVVGVSALTCAGLHLPLVAYQAEGRTYKVAGPRFTSGMRTEVSTPWTGGTAIESNLTSRQDLPDRLKVRIHRNSVVSVIKSQDSPLYQLYPLGSPADVWYDPARPRRAFVQRPAPASRWLAALLATLAAIMTVMGLVLLLGPRVTMH